MSGPSRWACGRNRFSRDVPAPLRRGAGQGLPVDAAFVTGACDRDRSLVSGRWRGASPTRVGSFTQNLVPGAVRGRNLPLVVMSHGNGGSFASHVDTAFALAEAGFVVAALTHTGDNYRDSSGATDLAARTRHLAAVIGHVGERWNPEAVNPERIGAFGFSSGGFTVLAAAGGTPDLTRITAHCAAHPAFYACRLIAGAAHAPAGGADALRCRCARWSSPRRPRLHLRPGFAHRVAHARAALAGGRGCHSSGAVLRGGGAGRPATPARVSPRGGAGHF